MARRQFPKPCLVCGETTNGGSRCAVHEEEYRLRRNSRPKPANHSQAYGYQWQKAAKEAIEQSPWCERCGHEGSADNPLTGDHVVPVAIAGVEVPLPDEIRVLCRRCNSAKGKRL